jgi:acyl-CoA reductase-like NAD-dependent aldehyde dehydrogenase
VRPVKFEGGGCNWSWIDDGYSDEELNRIAVRLTYSKLGLGSHKCTSLHGITGSKAVLDRIEPMIAAEMKNWRAADPRAAKAEETKIVSPLMVHKGATLVSIRDAAKKAGVKMVVEGAQLADSDYAQNAEVCSPLVLGRVTPETKVTVNWDGKEQTIALATTEFFMPILVTMESASFDDFLRFSLMVNPHDLATSLWTRDDAKLQRARRVLAGMLKENDGTDSALEWEEFGASGVGDSGNTGVGDAVTTIAMFCRRQKGRHLTF